MRRILGNENARRRDDRGRAVDGIQAPMCGTPHFAQVGESGVDQPDLPARIVGCGRICDGDVLCRRPLQKGAVGLRIGSLVVEGVVIAPGVGLP